MEKGLECRYDITTIIFAAKGKGADFVVVVSLTKH